MDLTTGSILRRITNTDLSVSAHKLATIILGGIAWKEGYNGLPRGTAAFTLSSLAERMVVSRQYLSVLLAELAASPLRLGRDKPHGKYAPWLFRFGTEPRGPEPHLVSSSGDTSLSRRESNKTIFAGMIRIATETNVFQTKWAALIRAAKTALPCWNVDTQEIWDRFLAFNAHRGNDVVPAGFLLGFMRHWRTSPFKQSAQKQPESPPPPLDPKSQELADMIRAAPIANRQFHASDLVRAVGQAAYDARVAELIRRFSRPRFTATLAVHRRAVMTGEISN